MNCKSVEPLLSLYVGRDLGEEHSRLVAAHLQTCTQCTLAADEYAGARELLKVYAPPFFSDQIYAGIREQVLNEIGRESHARVWPGIFSQSFLALVQPRMRWITAALLLAISVAALYLSRNRSHQLRNDHQVAVPTRQPGAEVRSENSARSSSFSNTRQDRMVTARGPITVRRKASAGVLAANRSRELNKTTKIAASTNDRVVQRAVGVTQPSPASAPLRVELQTSDRNIRIIWLSGQRPPAGGSDGSKGI